jgi:hypothetical protein
VRQHGEEGPPHTLGDRVGRRRVEIREGVAVEDVRAAGVVLPLELHPGLGRNLGGEGGGGHVNLQIQGCESPAHRLARPLRG